MPRLLPRASRTAAIIVTVVAAACGRDDAPPPPPIGGVQQLPNGMRIVTDPQVQDFITELGLAIARPTGHAADWRFYVVADPQINAFARPDGAIFVNSGLIQRADRLDELAGVLGHEIGHVVEEHALSEQEKGTATNVGVSLLCRVTNACDDRTSQEAIGAATAALQAHFSRSDEAAADSDAIENVMRAGIDPEGVPAMLDNLLAARQQQPTIVDEWFASHPLEEDRIRHTQRLLDRIPEQSLDGALQDTPQFHQFKERLAMVTRQAP